MSGRTIPISCNNCGSRDHLWAECEMEMDRDLKRQNAKWAHNSSGNNQLKFDRWAKRLAFKREGRTLNIAFLMDLIEANVDQLELSWEEFDSMCPLELDDNGYCPKKQSVLKFRDQLYSQQEELLCLISAAKGRAEVWSEKRDNTPAWDREMFEGKLEDLQIQRNVFYNDVLSSAKGVLWAEHYAQLIKRNKVKFQDLSAKVGIGLESIQPVELKVFKLKGPMEELSVVFNAMLSYYNSIKNYRIVSPSLHQLLEKDLLLEFLALENKYLKLEKNSLEDLVDDQGSCPICAINPINLRLVTEEGNCTHCMCDVCAQLLPLTNVSQDDWFPLMRQTCPYCREQVILEACVRLTLA